MKIDPSQTYGPAAPMPPDCTTASLGPPPSEVFFATHVMPVLGGSIAIGATQEGGWIALQVEAKGTSIRLVLDENEIDALLLALAHQS